MLRKLLKHEFRATARIMLPLFGLLVLASVGANLSIRGMLDSDIAKVHSLHWGKKRERGVFSSLVV